MLPSQRNGQFNFKTQEKVIKKKGKTYLISPRLRTILELIAPQRMGPRRVLKRGGKKKKYEKN